MLFLVTMMDKLQQLYVPPVFCHCVLWLTDKLTKISLTIGKESTCFLIYSWITYWECSWSWLWMVLSYYWFKLVVNSFILKVVWFWILTFFTKLLWGILDNSSLPCSFSFLTDPCYEPLCHNFQTKSCYWHSLLTFRFTNVGFNTFDHWVHLECLLTNLALKCWSQLHQYYPV